MRVRVKDLPAGCSRRTGGKGVKGSDKKESQMIDHRWVKAA